MKLWWQSKTLWFNAICAALATLEASTDLLKPYVGNGLYVALAVALPVVNAALRVLTTQGVALRREPQ